MPSALQEDLLDYNDVSGLFPNFLQFLIKFKKMADYKIGDVDVTQSNNKSKFCVVTGTTLKINSQEVPKDSLQSMVEAEHGLVPFQLICQTERTVI